jgi:hypothetical protein
MARGRGVKGARTTMDMTPFCTKLD